MKFSIANHFRNFRIEKIDYLLRSERQAVRGCFYIFAKFIVAIFSLGITANIFTLLIIFEKILPDTIYYYFSIVFALGAIPICLLLSIICINLLDTLWRRKEKEKYDAYEIELTDILKSYSQAEMLENYHKQIIQRVLNKYNDLNEQLGEMSNDELALIEDAILYTFETKGIVHAHAYGTKFMTLGLIIIGILTFVPLYSLIEMLMREHFPRAANSAIILYIFFPLAIFATWRGMEKSLYYWDKLGPTGRNFVRNLFFYWPLTLMVLIGLNTWAKYYFSDYI